MINDDHFTISELAERAQVTPRTIRYYTAEGVLPHPDMRGRYALYSIDHLHRLQLIARLKLSHLPLNEIRARLNQLGPHEVEQLLRDEPPAPPPESAIEYLAHVLERPSGSGRLVREQSALPSAIYSQQSTTEEYQRLSSNHTDRQQRRPVQRIEHQPAARPASFFKRPEANADTRSETWQRITLSPGVELHVQSTVMQQSDSQIKQLLERAQQLFGEHEQP